MVVNILCSHAFSTIRGLFFQRLFCIKSYWKLEPEQKSQIGGTLFSETFYFKDFFPQDFYSAKILDFISENFFQGTFFGGYPQDQINILELQKFVLRNPWNF